MLCSAQCCLALVECHLLYQPAPANVSEQVLTPAMHCSLLLPHTQGQRVINPHEKRWFWIVLVADPILWALACLTAFLGFSWGECVVEQAPCGQQTHGLSSCQDKADIWEEIADAASAGVQHAHMQRSKLSWGELYAKPQDPSCDQCPYCLCLCTGYLLIPVTGALLGGSNLFGYFKCSKEASAQLKSMTGNLVTSAMTSRLTSAMARV